MGWIADYLSHLKWFELVGYGASILVACSFYMKTMVPLRILALCSNVTFIIYGLFGELPPVFVLHVFLLPLNIYRLYQMKKLVNEVKRVTGTDYSMDWLVPYMTRRTFKRGEVLFKKGDEADGTYYLKKGSIRLPELERVVKEGEIIGEIGVFSPFRKRTASAICEEDLEAFSIGNKKMTHLYFQNPSFGFYLIRLIIQRLIGTYQVERNSAIENAQDD